MSIQLRPSEIKYSQDSISCTFSHQLIGETLDDVCEGRTSVNDIPLISVAKVEDEWVTYDNRRLWVFRHLERLGKCKKIQVLVKDKIPHFRMNSKCDGEDVTVRGDPGGEWHKKDSSSSLFWTVAGCIGTGAGAGAAAAALLLFLEKK